ncbi:hypothetical protein KUTeg_022726, partial [Tegillarca granosa]
EKREEILLQGPTGYPVIGNTLDVDGTRIHLKLTHWAEIFGDIYEVNLFGSTVVVLNSPELIRKAFLTEPNATLFSDRVKGSVAQEILHESKDIVFGAYSESWVKRRKLGHKVLKAYGAGIKNIEKSVTEELTYVTSKLMSYNGKPFDPEVVLNDFLNQIIAILLTGRRHGEANNEMTDAISTYDKCMNEIFDQQTWFLIDWLPFMRFVPSKASRVYYATKQSQKKNTSSKGMIHALFEEMEHLHKSKPKDDWLTEDSVFAILTNMVAAGILTSQGTLLTAIRILLERKDVQRKLQSEVDCVVGIDRPPSMTDRKHMPYLEAFLLEVIMNLWKINYSNFSDPYEFKPERFLDENGDLLHTDTPDRQKLLSFGVGKRSCIGESFARNQMEDIGVVLSVIILSLTFFVMLKRKKRRNPSPGPAVYSVIGNTFDVDGSKIHNKLTHWAEMYGDIYEVNLFGSTVVVLNSPEIIRKAFLTEPNATLFSGRLEGSLTNEIFYQTKDIAFGPYSEPLIKRRKLGHKILKAYGAGIKEIENRNLTSQGTLLIAIPILLERKDVQRKLQSEVDRTTIFDRQKTHVVSRAFLLEVLRYGTNTPIAVPHKLIEGTTLEGYDLLKDSWVIMNLWKINHDESIFPDPYEFKPERFLDENGDLLQGDTPDRQKFLLFGVGKRSCIGESFARNRMFLFLATMMQYFTFEPEAENIAKFDPRDMQTTSVRFPHHFKCRVERRHIQ